MIPSIHIDIQCTSNDTIIKFVVDRIISPDKNYEFKNVDEALISPLCKELFFLPFVKRILVSVNFIAIERYNIVKWKDVQEEVKEKIKEYLQEGKKVIDQTINKQKNVVSIYAESTPNSNVMKFVANKYLVEGTFEYENSLQANDSNLAKELFKFPFVEKVFMTENYIAITKIKHIEWIEISQELRNFIREYIVQGREIVNQMQSGVKKQWKEFKEQGLVNFTEKEKQIDKILKEYVRPAVMQDGGNIVLQSFDSEKKIVNVILQGACNGCPSSSITLKNGIEQLLKEMMPDEICSIEAINK